MGKVLAGYLFPHPPLIVEEIGMGQELGARKTIKGCRKLVKDISDKSPSTIIVVTPHGPLFSDAIAISMGEILQGDFKDFGNKELSFKYENNLEIIDSIVQESYHIDIPVARVDNSFACYHNISTKLDHGTLVPLYFVEKEYSAFKLIHITYGLLSLKDLYRFGKLIQEIVLKSDEQAIFIASGDLSHKLSDKGPYNYSPYGEKFDNEIVELLRKGDFKSIASFDLHLTEKAGQCALRSLVMLAGFLDGFKIESELVSYEGPFGVGYCNAKFSISGKPGRSSLYDHLIQSEKEKINHIRNREDQYVALARRSLEHYVRYGEKMRIPKHIGNELLDKSKGVFVTIKKNGVLRGCIGSIEPTQKTLADEIVDNAISAGTRDPRFEQVSDKELEELVYSVDVLNKPEAIESKEELDVERYGVIVSKGLRKGLLLPNLEGIDTEEEQIRVALMKAGINENENYSLERFEVIRHY